MILSNHTIGVDYWFRFKIEHVIEIYYEHASSDVKDHSVTEKMWVREFIGKVNTRLPDGISMMRNGFLVLSHKVKIPKANRERAVDNITTWCDKAVEELKDDWNIQ